MLLTPVFWPQELHGLYSTWSHKESDTAEPLSLPLCHPTFSVTALEVKYNHHIFTGEETEAQSLIGGHPAREWQGRALNPGRLPLESQKLGIMR